MASPAAAGLALLIRQYFIDSNSQFYLPVCLSSYKFCKSFSPSGVLIKAILLHSGQQMALWEGGGGIPLGAPPDNYQGYGLSLLKNVLPLKNVFIFNLFVDDLVTINAESSVTYLANVRKTSLPLK